MNHRDTTRPSSFIRATVRALVRMNKVGGTLEYIAEQVQYGRPIPGELIDEYYHRMWRLEDALAELRRTPQWQDSDVEDFDDADP